VADPLFFFSLIWRWFVQGRPLPAAGNKRRRRGFIVLPRRFATGTLGFFFSPTFFLVLLVSAHREPVAISEPLPTRIDYWNTS